MLPRTTAGYTTTLAWSTEITLCGEQRLSVPLQLNAEVSVQCENELSQSVMITFQRSRVLFLGNV